MASKIFVGNLAFRTSREQVEGLFQQAGSITDVYFPMDRDTGRPRGFAFVTFSTDEEAAAAIQKFNGFELDGRALRVNAAEERPRAPRGDYGGGGGYGGGYGGGGGDYDRGGGGGGDYGGGGYGGGGGKAKGSRRNIRAKKRGL